MSNNHHSDGENVDVDDDNNSDNVTNNGTHLNDNGAKNSAEELILQNAKLKSTVDKYKSIVAETVRIRFSLHCSHVFNSN